jgi:multidrug resistance protein MdtO
MAGTTLPLFWTIFGFYGFVDLAGWDAHHSADAIVTSSLYNLASLALVVSSTAAVEYIFGTKHPAQELNHEITKRLTSLRRYFASLANIKADKSREEMSARHHELIQYAHAGDIYLNELYDKAKDSIADPAQVPLGIHYRIGLLSRVLDKTVVFGFHLRQSEDITRREAYQALTRICDDLLAARTPVMIRELPATELAPLREIYEELVQYADLLKQPIDQRPTIKRSTGTRSLQFFLPGVFDTSDTTFYALKLTLAAMICYIIYNAVAWPGILTCVVTVLFTGLSSTGAMKQKQLYRVSGAMIGGILAIFTVSFLFPNMDSITSLIAVVAAVAFLSGWILRSPRMSYVGVQIGFAFFLTALPGFSATTQIAPARDRVIGVALGILIMWFVFDQLWPVRTTDVLQASLRRIEKSTAALQQLIRKPDAHRDSPDFQRLRSAVSLELASVQQLEFSAQFEVGRHRKRELAKTRKLICQIESSSAEFYRTALPLPD